MSAYTTTATSQSHLAYVALASRDMERTGAFLADDLALPHTTIASPEGDHFSAFSVGSTHLVVFPERHPFLSTTKPGVDHIAITVGQIEKSFAETALTPAGPTGPGLGEATLQAGLESTDTCGVQVRFTTPLTLPCAKGDLISRIDHIGIASSDNAEAETIFCEKMGAIYESRQTDIEVQTAMESFTSDKYGAIYHARQPEIVGGLRVSFLTMGDLELEFLQDFDPSSSLHSNSDAAGTTKQDQSAIGRYVQKHGAGLHHIAFKVPDIDAILARLKERGHRMIDTKGRPGSRRARIGFIHPASTGGILFHFVQRDELTPQGV